MPSYSGIWSLSQQFQGRGQGLWPVAPGAPTIGTATAGGGNTASITFTAPACAGVPATITGYTATSTPGCITGTGSSSPITVSGLTNGTSYTFKVKAQNVIGFGACSAASNSITATNANSQSYTTPGTYTWVAPACVTSVSVVAVGGGGGGSSGGAGGGGGGGALTYRNNVSVTPGTGYTVVVGSAGAGGAGCFNPGDPGGNSTALSMIARGGQGGTTCGGTGGSPCGTFTAGNYGGYGGQGGNAGGGGAAAAGYTVNAPNGGNVGAAGTNGSGGSGGSGAGGGSSFVCTGSVRIWGYGGNGGGTGLLGQGSNGTGGVYVSNGTGGCGTAGSSGSGKSYGGGGGGGQRVLYFCCCGNFSTYSPGINGGGGAVRIIWPGTTRSFPSTSAGTP